jgi:membrane protein YqaA with SNARE-associated domain
MSTVASYQVIQKSEIHAAGAGSGLGTFLLGFGGVVLSFVWGFAEAMFFFVVPDVLLSLVSIFSLKRVWRHIAAAIAGAVAGGALMFFWAKTNPDSAVAAVKKVPFVTNQMFAHVETGFGENGMVAIYLGPMTGTPYKIYAVEAPKFVSFTSFLLATIPARGWRFILVSLFAAACASVLRKYGNKNLRQLTRWHVLAWTAFYIFYWTRIAMS